MKEIDDVSHSIGSLEAGLISLKEMIARHHAIVDHKMDRLISITSDVDKKADRAHERIDDIKEDLDKALEYSIDWNESKKKAKWVIGGSVAASTISGFSIGKLINAIFSHGLP